ncbi:MAG: glycoside hydrolase family 13 protein [Flavisolibacter sp.]
MKSYLLIIAFLFGLKNLGAQTKIDLYPMHWWVGMKNPHLQLMVHAPNIGAAQSATLHYSGAHIKSIHQVESKNYLFIDLYFDRTILPGILTFHLNTGRSFTFELKSRRSGNGTQYAKGVGPEDFIYLIMPDRFSNGDEKNDKVSIMKDQSLNRDSMYLRHGGDLQGVINHLDYLQELGITTLWLTPVFENDMPDRTEHGYAITNHYQIDPRLGTAETYRNLSTALHKRGMKLIQDAVYNHCGLYHFFIQDMPMKNWVHQWPKYTQTTYKDQIHFDPYGARVDQKLMLDGWFTPQMPDLNQGNPFVANFLIQNAIWSVEEYGVDGWRIDTYIYVDPAFMNHCNQALLEQYPKMTMFGEAWVHGTANEAYFTRNNMNTRFKSNATGVLDFQCLFEGIQPALSARSDGGNQLYQTLSNDFLYQQPLNNVIFLDNHDMTRFFSQVQEDTAKLKMGIGWLLTERGTPEMYYGTEILLKGISNPDGLVRGDFPGGWKGDTENKFISTGRTRSEAEIFNWVKAIANYRKKSSALTRGKLLQYVPENGIYTYFRYQGKERVMVLLNFNQQDRKIETKRFEEMTAGYRTARDIVSGAVYPISDQWTMPAKTIWILELQKSTK